MCVVTGALSGNSEPKESEKAGDTNGTTFRDCLTDEGTTIEATQVDTEQPITAQVGKLISIFIN